MKLVHNVYTKPKTSNERRLSAPSTKIADGVLYVKYYTLPYYWHHVEIDLCGEVKLPSSYCMSRDTYYVFIWNPAKSNWRYRPYLTPKKYKYKGKYWIPKPGTLKITKKLYGI